MQRYEAPTPYEPADAPQLCETGREQTTRSFETPGEPTLITPSTGSALLHRPEIYQPPVERIEDTTIGPVVICSQDMDRLPYGAEELIAALSATKPHDFPRLGQNSLDHLALAPDNPDVVIRWNRANFRGMPRTPEQVAEYLQQFEGEVERLRRLGMPVLHCNVCIVEQDPHHGNNPTIYTIAGRHSPSQPLVDIGDNGPITTNVDTHVHTAGIVSAYLGETPPGAPYIFDGLAYPRQFATDGTWLDTDVCTVTNPSPGAQLQEVKWWVRRLPDSQERQELLDKIKAHGFTSNRHRGNLYRNDT